MTSKDMNDMVKAIRMSVGVIQGAFKEFLKENDGDIETALALTEITWNGFMLSVGKEDGNNQKLFQKRGRTK